MTPRKGIPGATLVYQRKRKDLHEQLKRETAQKRMNLLPRPKREKRG